MLTNPQPDKYLFKTEEFHSSNALRVLWFLDGGAVLENYWNLTMGRFDTNYAYYGAWRWDKDKLEIILARKGTTGSIFLQATEKYLDLVARSVVQ